MELVAIEETRLVELFTIARPQGQLHLPTVIEMIQNEFHFAEANGSLEDVKTNGLQLYHGNFKGLGIAQLSIHNDGVVIVSASPTQFLRDFLDSLKRWAVEKLQVSFVKTHDVGLLHQSYLVVKTNKPILSPIAQLGHIRSFLKAELEKNSGYEDEFDAFGFTMSVDPQHSLRKPVAFTIERKAGIDFKLNHFYSRAPLPTESHLRVLKAIESTF